jgi:hypothetical protein
MSTSVQAVLNGLNKTFNVEQVALMAALHGITLPNRPMSALELNEHQDVAACLVVRKGRVVYRMNRGEGLHLGKYLKSGYPYEHHCYHDWFFLVLLPEDPSPLRVNILRYTGERNSYKRSFRCNEHPGLPSGGAMEQLELAFIRRDADHEKFVFFNPMEGERTATLLQQVVRYLAALENIPEGRRNALLACLHVPKVRAAA